MEAAAVPLRSSRRARELLAFAALAGLIATSVLIVAGSEGGLNVLVPAAKLRFPGWLRGPLSGIHSDLNAHGLGWLVAGMGGCYLVALACVDGISARVGIATVVALHLLFLLAPPLISSDVFGYIDIARLGTLHGIDPYSAVTTHLPPDAVHLYRRWGTDIPSPYGPLFTIASYAVVPLGIAGAMWALKVLTAAGSLATIWLVWRCAEKLGRDPLKAALFVGLNPIVLLFAVGGAHNDFFAITLVMAGVYLTIAGRERLSGAALTAAAAFKLPTGLPFAFAFVSARGRRRDLVIGAVLTLVAVAVLSIVTFGSHAGGFLKELREQQNQVAIYSVPNQVGKALGFGGITQGIRIVADVGLAAVVLLALRAAWRGADWIAMAGWATLALLVSTAWLLPWYVTWLLPLAAVSGNRRLKLGALAFATYVVITRVSLWTSLPV